MKHLLNWVEIPVANMERGKKFYSTILGIEMAGMTMAGMEYAFFPTEDRFNCGALVKGEHYKPNADGITVYLDGGNDLNTILQKVEKAGGTVLMEKTFFSKEAGYIGMFLDSEGNKIGLQNS